MGKFPKFSEIRAEKYLANKSSPVTRINLTNLEDIQELQDFIFDALDTDRPSNPPIEVIEQDRWRAKVITDQGDTFIELLIIKGLIHVGGDLRPGDWAPDTNGSVWDMFEGKLYS